MEAVERAEHSRAPVQQAADRYAGWLVYFALGCAAVTLLIMHNARSTISVMKARIFPFALATALAD
ncbi:MAG TPA: hypothetical protein VLV45_15345 [Gemmatimonadales bacterium]|nr:hypothetical protein [Gemmatimonadales bacterium]